MILVEVWRHTDYYANQVALLPAGSCIARNSTGRILVQMSPFSSVSYCLPSQPLCSFPEVKSHDFSQAQGCKWVLKAIFNKAPVTFHEHANKFGAGGQGACCAGKATWRSPLDFFTKKFVWSQDMNWFMDMLQTRKDTYFLGGGGQSCLEATSWGFWWKSRALPSVYLYH